MKTEPRAPFTVVRHPDGRPVQRRPDGAREIRDADGRPVIAILDRNSYEEDVLVDAFADHVERVLNTHQDVVDALRAVPDEGLPPKVRNLVLAALESVIVPVIDNRGPIP